MRRIRFFSTAEEVAGADIEKDIAVVADVLRATSTIVTALANGCEMVLPVEHVQEAREAAAQHAKDKVILGGERRGKLIDGFDFGNSPQDYAPEAVGGRVVITTTTNGTKALVYSARAKESLVLSFLNMSAIRDYIIEKDRDVALIAAGIYGKYSIEDSVCCGMLLHELIKLAPNDFCFDRNATDVFKVSRDYIGRVDDLLQTSPHGSFLRQINYESDLAVCARVDAYPIVPLYKEGYIKIIEQ